MADPTKYTKGYSFEGYQANSPSKPLPASRLDDELENISTSIDETIDALKDIRRSDGALQNGIVTAEAMESSLYAPIAAVPGLAASAAASAASAAGSAVLALQYANAAVAQANVPIFSTAAAVALLSLPSDMNALRLDGFSTPGFGGALYVKVGSEPSHYGKVQSANGIWFELAERIVAPQMFGALPAAQMADATVFIQRALDFAALKKTPVLLNEMFNSGPLKLKSGVSLFGQDWSSGLTAIANAGGPLVALDQAAMPVKYTKIFGFKIDGNSANQAVGYPAVEIAYPAYDPDGGGSTALRAVRHQVHSMWIVNSKGDGIRTGYAVNDTMVFNNIVYFCDGVGISSSGSADCFYASNDIGQSGQQGLLISGSNVVVSGNKIWCSGRITAGRAGISVFKAHYVRLIGNETQENSGPGVEVSTNAGQLKGLIISGHVCDSDNTALGTSTPEIKLTDVLGAQIHATVQNNSTVNGDPVSAIQLLGATEQCYVRIDARDYAGTTPVDDKTAGLLNDIDLNCRNSTVKLVAYTATYTPTLWEASAHRIGPLTGNIYITKPVLARHGMQITLEWTQDTTGGRRVVLDAAYAEDVVFDLRPSRTTRITFQYDYPTDTWRQISASTGLGGAELLGDSGLASLASWTQVVTGDGVISLDAGGATLTVTTSGLAEIRQALVTVVGQRYRMEVAGGGGAMLAAKVGTTPSATDLLDEIVTSSQIKAFEFTATTTTSYIRLYRNVPGAAKVARVSVRAK